VVCGGLFKQAWRGRSCEDSFGNVQEAVAAKTTVHNGFSSIPSRGYQRTSPTGVKATTGAEPFEKYSPQVFRSGFSVLRGRPSPVSSFAYWGWEQPCSVI
jgi:hypothetical protein